MWEKPFNLHTEKTDQPTNKETETKTKNAVLTDLLQTSAQVAAEDIADAVYFHAMDAGLHIPFLHPLQVGFLLKGEITATLSEAQYNTHSLK